VTWKYLDSFETNLTLKSSEHKGQMQSYARASRTTRDCKHWLKNLTVSFDYALLKSLNLRYIDTQDQSSYMPEGVLIFMQRCRS
jgi:hypothetical protein